MKLLVFEPDHDGHRLQYVHRMLPGLMECGEVTVAITQAAAMSAEYRVHLSSFEGKLKIDSSISSRPTPGGLRGAFGKLLRLRQAIRRNRPDRVYIPYLDGMAQLMGISRAIWRWVIPHGVAVEGLMMANVFAYPEVGRRRRIRARLSWQLVARSPWARLYLLDLVAHQQLVKEGRPVVLMPEPTEAPPGLSRSEARSRLGVPMDGRYVGIAGLIDRRKGVDLLIRAFSNANLADSDRLLLVGRHRPEIRAMLDGEFAPLVRSGRIQSIDRVVTVEEFSIAVDAMDLVCLPYPFHLGSVSMAARAVAAGRPVLGSDTAWMGRVIRRFGLGTTINVNDVPGFAVSLADALDQAGAFRTSEAGRRFAKFHTVANFRAVWAGGVRDELGLAPDPDRVKWEWVLESL